MNFRQWFSSTSIANTPATFTSATLDNVIAPVINGANYTAFETGDGWFTIRDIFIFGEVPKGVKEAPEDVKGQRMAQMVANSRVKYENEKYAAPAHKGHHKMLEFQDPEFLGFVLPKRVGQIMLDGKLQDAVFGDVKLKASAFERVLKGELPYVSPEVDWNKWEFSSLSFLDSKPPHFKGPLITIGEVIKDPTARFEVESSTVKGKFMADAAPKKDDENEKKGAKFAGKKGKAKMDAGAGDGDAGGDAGDSGDAGDAGGDASGDAGFDGGGDGGDAGFDDGGDGAFKALGSRVAKMEAGFEAMDKSLGNIHFKMGLPYKGAYMQAETFKKPSSNAPREQDGGAGVTKGSQAQNNIKFENDPEARAKFAALEMQTKALEDKIAKRELEETIQKRVTAAFEDLKGYPLTDTVKTDIAEFAKDENLLKRYVASVKAQTPKDPPKSVAAFQAVGMSVKPVTGTDPDIAEFQAQGPEKAEAAIRYAMAYEAWKNSPAAKFSRFRSDRKAFIKEYMAMDATGHALDSILPGGF